MAELSPAAQAVLDAFGNARDGEYVESVWIVNECAMLAAALRTVADELIPPVVFNRRHTTEERWDARDDIRFELLAIAAELEDAGA